MKYLFSFLLLVLCLSCGSPSTKKTEYEINLSNAKVLRITERLEVMIASEDEVLSESKKLIIDSIIGYTQKWAVYDENGKVILFYISGSEGFIPHSLNPKKGYLPLEGTYSNYECKIDKDENYIIDMAEPKSGEFDYVFDIEFITDTIRDFVIIQRDKIILSKQDYLLLQKSKDGSNSGKRYILYRYE